MEKKPSAVDGLDAATGRRAAVLMWDLRVTQTELAERLGVDQTTLSKKLRGARPWNLSELAAVARELGTSVAYLVGEADDPRAAPVPPSPAA